MHGWPSLSSSVDSVFLFITAVSVVLLVGVTGTMVWFTIRYSRKRNPAASNIAGNLTLEIVWTVIPTLLVLAMFWVGWKGFVFMRTVPGDALPIKVTARMWSWDFEYENGRHEGKLRVPLNKPVKLTITSLDVLHSLSIPAFRVKEDAVPGRETYLWFLPSISGIFDLFCTEYCGTGHSAMTSTVLVMPAEEFEKWYREGAPSPGLPNQQSAQKPDGAKLVREKGCVACHSLDGSPRVGPTLKGVYGRSEIVITRGSERTITADHEYLERSLLDPAADVVKGYPAIMPSQKGLLSDDEIDAIIRYLQRLK